jgi:sporulation protein YlmC with PRC-barrel domain
VRAGTFHADDGDLRSQLVSWQEGELTMLRSLKDFEGYAVSATDGEVGVVVDFLLDDERWIVRNLVVAVGGPDGGREVLISPISFGRTDGTRRDFHLALTLDRITKSPDVNTKKPVSRQHEREYYNYYGYQYYWGYTGTWGMGMYPGILAAPMWNELPVAQDGAASYDVHLRSAKEVRGYHVHGSDAPVGHVKDFIVDDETWEVRYLVIDTSNWWFGKSVLVAPHWATRVSWGDRAIDVDMSREAIKDSPAWNPKLGVNRLYETRLYDYYGRPTYWPAKPARVSGREDSREAKT